MFWLGLAVVHMVFYYCGFRKEIVEKRPVIWANIWLVVTCTEDREIAHLVNDCRCCDVPYVHKVAVPWSEEVLIVLIHSIMPITKFAISNGYASVTSLAY